VHKDREMDITWKVAFAQPSCGRPRERVQRKRQKEREEGIGRKIGSSKRSSKRVTGNKKGKQEKSDECPRPPPETVGRGSKEGRSKVRGAARKKEGDLIPSACIRDGRQGERSENVKAI